LEKAFFDFELYDIPEDSRMSDKSSSDDSVVIIVNKDDYQAQKELLHKIFSAVGLELEGYNGLHIIDKGSYINITEIAGRVGTKVICFGTSPKNLGLNSSFKGYRIYNTETYQVLLSHSLAQLAVKKERKKALWDALQGLFIKKSS